MSGSNLHRLLPALLLPALFSSCSKDASVNAPIEVNEGTLPTCEITPAQGFFVNVNAIKITVSCPTPGATIRYTLDGSQPTSRSTPYADSIKPLKYTNALDIKVRAWSGTDSSPWVQAILLDSIHDPIYIYRGASLFSQSILVGLGYMLNTGWTYLYTTDGSEPSAVAEGTTKAFANAFPIEAKTRLRVKAMHGSIAYPVVFERTFTPTPPYAGSFETFVDARDGQTYRTIRIGSQTWMAENLRYRPATGGATCYGGDSALCKSDGVLYNWATAMDLDSGFNLKSWTGSDRNHRGICPAGAHVPSDSEWTQMQLAVQALPEVGTDNADLALMSDSGWLNNRTWKRDDLFGRLMVYTYTPGNWTYNGVDAIGFSVLPTGKLRNDGAHMFRQYYSGFWTSTPARDFVNFSWSRSFYGGFRGIWRDVGSERIEGLSVRCVLDP